MSDDAGQQIIERQRQETVDQTAEGVPVRLATITCRCGRKRSVMLAVQCLYCREWMCEPCAEAHFGKTREQHRTERAKREGGGDE